MEIRRLIAQTAFASAVVLAGLGQVVAQVIPGTPYGGSLEGYYQTWDVDEGTSTTLTQMYVPINIYLPLADRFEARLSSGYVSMTTDTEFDESQSVSGLTDPRIQLAGSFLERRLIVGLVVNLPSGGGDLSSAEQDIVFDFISPDLSVRTNRIGEGFNYGGTISFANALSRTVTIGLGASVLNRGGYDTSLPGHTAPISLTPGLESRASASLDVVLGKSVVRLSSTFAMYGTEKVNDVDNYKIGREVSVAADYSLAYSSDRGQFSLGVYELLRFDNSVVSNGTLQTEQASVNGNYFVAHAANDYGVSPTVRITVSALGRLIGPNEFDVGDSTVLEGGLAATVLASSNVALTLGGRYVKGSGTGFSGRDRDVSGIEGMFRTVVRLD